MNVSEEFKTAFKSTSVTKHVQIYFYTDNPSWDYTVPEPDVYEESMDLVEKLTESEDLEFVGCIATKFEIDIRDFGVDIKDKNIIAYIYPEGLEEQKIRIFSGVVDEAKLQSNHKIKRIVAYDELYTKGQKDVSAWYNRQTFPKTLGELRRSLFAEIGIPYHDLNLPNDTVKIKKKYYKPSNLSAISVIKSICQINGVFGMIGRDGWFKYVVLPEINSEIVGDGAYPGNTLYPPFYPGVDRVEGDPENLPRYKTLDYQEYTVQAINRVTVRQNSEDDGATVGSGPNRYIVQGNIFTYKMNKATLQSVAEGILSNVRNVSFTPYSSNNMGLPWLECGEDVIRCVVYDFDNSTSTTDVYKSMEFYVLNRNLKGIQNLKDNYDVQGDKYQKETVTDLGLNIDIRTTNIKQEVIEEIEGDYYNKEEIDEMLGNLPTSSWSVESVASLPSQGQMNVLYLIQGEVVVN